MPDASFGSNPTTGRNVVLLGTLKAAVAEIKARLGQDASQWAWGKLHHIQFDHELAPFLPKSTAVSYATRSYSIGGTNDTVHRGTYRNSDYRQISGSSYRQVIDLDNWDNSLVISAPGQSADPASPHYANLLEGWATGNYFPMAFTKEAVESQRADTVTLKPVK
ncbi:penicillin acylase family protein [Polaromonas sp. CG_23.6]|uniref:penicillin acylase family protein n=1 Tax=Polaromonas sp. CG_23.6 TaxID=2760709 RepID=UPI0032AF4886